MIQASNEVAGGVHMLIKRAFSSVGNKSNAGPLRLPQHLEVQQSSFTATSL